jgi:hypothetical protein
MIEQDPHKTAGRLADECLERLAFFFQQEQCLRLLPKDSHKKYGNPYNKKENNHVDQ